jgi:hypothetical protein
MATQPYRLPRTRWLGPPSLISCKRVCATRQHRHKLEVVALFTVFLLVFQGSLPFSARAASYAPLTCPTSPSPGVGECQGTALTGLAPAHFSPPSGGPLAWGGEWSVCMSWSDATRYAYDLGQLTYLVAIQDIFRQNNGYGLTWTHNWILTLLGTADGAVIMENAYPYDPNNVSSNPPPWPNVPCAPPSPPCMTCLPQMGSVFSFDFWAYAPVASITGSARCPPGSLAGSWCPPSVGNPVTLAVTGFHSTRGPTGVTEDLGTVDGFADVTLSINWNPAQRVGLLSWNFDDEQVNATTGQAQRSPVVTSGVNQPVSHTFAYSSAFDPIRQCVRTCPGDLPGPPIAGYPHGTPAFQVSVASHWNLIYTERVTDFAGQTATITYAVDLRQFGSPTSYFTSVTTLPLFVVSYGSVTP